LSLETKKALFYHAEPRSQNRGGEAKRGKIKLFWSPGTIWRRVTKANVLAVSVFGKISDVVCGFLAYF